MCSTARHLQVYVVDINCFLPVLSNAGKSEELSSSSSGSSLNELNIIVSHGDCVKTLPPDGVLLAHSESCQHEIFIVGKGLSSDSDDNISTSTGANKRHSTYACIKSATSNSTENNLGNYWTNSNITMYAFRNKREHSLLPKPSGIRSAVLYSRAHLAGRGGYEPPHHRGAGAGRQGLLRPI